MVAEQGQRVRPGNPSTLYKNALTAMKTAKDYISLGIEGVSQRPNETPMLDAPEGKAPDFMELFEPPAFDVR